ncbi:MAG: hypothetical protein GF335_02380 [Candidatus Moranbacteria bacterium]|nr:hypothetical protein [Candidatus Moranbacteria bacterium]
MKKTIFTSLIFGTILLSGCSLGNDETTELQEKIFQLEKDNEFLIQENQDLKKQIEDFQKSAIINNNSNDAVQTSVPDKNKKIIFDNCGKINNYNKNSWYSNFTATLNSNNIAINDISEICLSLNNTILIAITSGEYCEPGIIFQYNIPKDIITKATFNDHGRGCVSWPNEFGERDGDIISLQGFGVDAGCTSTMYYNYNYIENTIYLKKECNQCQQAPETCHNY